MKSVRESFRSIEAATTEEASFSVASILRWVYFGRMVLVSGILLGALFAWGQARPDQTFGATVMFVAALALTTWSVWHTWVHERAPSRPFVYSQVVFDTLLVTAVVHITGGAGSAFAALYIPLIAVSAVILPFPGVAIVGILCAILYLSDAAWGGEIAFFTGPIMLQVGLFGTIAVATGFLGDRLRRAGTALGEVESELARLRLDTSEILGSVSSGILTVDEQGRMVFLNPAGEALLGLDARQWTQAPVLGAVEEVSPELAEHLRVSIAEGDPLYRKMARVDRDGEHITIGVATTVRDAPDEPRAVTAIFQDITDQEKLAMLDRQNERLGAVAELAASMAHEIKNPLASIRSAVEQFTSPRITDDDRVKLTRMVVRESDRLSRLLSDFIDFTRVRVGDRESVEINGLVRDVLVVVAQHPDADRRGVVFRTSLPPDGAYLDGATDILHRALFNLVLNAVQFSPDGGEVWVTVENADDMSDVPDVGVSRPMRVRVRDQGPGVPDDEVSRLFDPFFTTRHGGSGLGLALVHRAVEAHHGVILVESPAEGGAQFTMYLPGAKHEIAVENAHV
jgi:two-component system, NtrC family, sensor histidine kinase PilS